MTNRRRVVSAIGATISVSALSRVGQTQQGRAGTKETIAILGTGHLGQALAKGWQRVGHPIIYGSRTPDDDRVKRVIAGTGSGTAATTYNEAAAQASVIVFALPWRAVKDLMPAIGDLAGKIVIDPMNAMQFVEHYPVAPSNLSTSVAEVLQSWVPNAKVVKAFNTPSVYNIVDPRKAGGHVTIALAGADKDAKARVAELVSALGLEPVDTGPLIAARTLEGMMRLSFGYYIYSKGKSFEFYFAPVTDTPQIRGLNVNH